MYMNKTAKIIWIVVAACVFACGLTYFIFKPSVYSWLIFGSACALMCMFGLLKKTENVSNSDARTVVYWIVVIVTAPVYILYCIVVTIRNII